MKRTNKACEHKRKLKSGKTVIVNKGVTKAKKPKKKVWDAEDRKYFKAKKKAGYDKEPFGYM